MYMITYNDCTCVYDKNTHKLLVKCPTEQEAYEYITENT